MRITLVVLKTIALAIAFTAAAGYGAFLYSPHDGFLYSHPENNPFPLFQPFVAGAFGLLYFANFGLYFLGATCTAAVWYADYRPSARALSPFWIFALTAVVVGIVVGVIHSLIAGRVPVMEI